MTAGLGLRVRRREDALIALNGNSIATEGVAEVEAERFDGPVYLSGGVFQAIVVTNLDVVTADLLVRADLMVILGSKVSALNMARLSSCVECTFVQE